MDVTQNSELSHTVNRYTLVNPVKLGNITELGTGAYLSQTLQLSSRFTINAGLRFDQFYYRYKNKLAADSTLSGAKVYKAGNHIISPKLRLTY